MDARTFSSAELDGLISELMDGQLTDEQKARLAEILRDCPEAQRYYQQLIWQHAWLHFDAVPLPSDPVTSLRLDATTPRDNRDSVEVEKEGLSVPPVEVRGLGWATGTAWFLAAGGVLLVALLGMVLGFFARSPRPASSNSGTSVVAAAGETKGQDDYVATLAVAMQCHWDSPHTLQEGGRLLPGHFRLLAGTAVIQFDSGPTLRLVGPALIEIQSKASAKILQGMVLLKNNLSGDQFTLSTPTARLLDIGTEFGVVVDSHGEEVHVFEGAVKHITDASSGDTRRTEQLEAGNARHYDESTEAGQPIPLDSRGFSRDNPLLSASSKRDEPIAFEPFDYPPGEMSAPALAVGQGWKRFWVWDGKPRIVQDHRGFPGKDASPSMRFAEFTRKGALHRWLAQPIRMDQDGIYYFSFLFRRGHEQPDPINALVVVLRNEDEMDDAKTLRLGIMGEDQVLFVTCADGGSRTSFPLSYDTTCLLVGKIVTGQSAPDQVFLKVFGPNDTVERREPAVWTLSSRPFRSDAVIDTFIFHSNSTSSERIGQIRLGNTWASVTRPWNKSKQ
jgi:hypothetical protein